MAGKIAIGLVTISVPGEYTFSDGQITQVVGETAKGTQYLSSIEPGANVFFTYEQHHVTIQGDVKVPGTGLSASPSVVIFDNKIYCFHQSLNNTGQLWYNVYDGR
jgi:hypothetical protein